MSQKRERGNYKASDYTWKEREMFAKMGVVWTGRNQSVTSFHTFLSESDIHVGLTSLRGWIREAAQDGVVYLSEKQSGNSRKLSEMQEQLTVGRILWHILNNLRIDTNNVIQWIKEEFDIDVSSKLVYSMTRRYDIVIRKAQTRSNGFSLNLEEATQQMYDFIRPLKYQVFQCKDSSLICSIDFTYTSHRNRTSKTFGLRGR